MAQHYVQTSGNLQTNSGSLTAISGLSLTLPGGVGVEALVILNVPNPYATGSNYPGGAFAIAVNGQALPMVATFTYPTQQASGWTSNRIPTTLVVGVPLTEKQQTIQAMWSGIRGATVILDSPASLTVIMD